MMDGSSFLCEWAPFWDVEVVTDVIEGGFSWFLF